MATPVARFALAKLSAPRLSQAVPRPRLLDRIDWREVAASRKVFCGYSDVTAFSLAALARADYVTFAGPVTAGEFAQTENEEARNFAERHFVALLSSDRYVYPATASDIDHGSGTVRGTLWGTNLAMITHLVGTPFMPQVDDGILLLEDIGEAPYRVERMFWQLKHAGILDRQRAVILGAFTDCEPAAGMRYPYSLAEALVGSGPMRVHTGFSVAVSILQMALRIRLKSTPNPVLPFVKRPQAYSAPL